MFGRKNKNKNKKSQPKPAPVSVTPQSSLVAAVVKPVAAPPPPADRGTAIVNIGRSVHIKGELTGNEDLTIDGKVEGSIQLRDHDLTISANGHITADVSAKSAVIFGHVVGDIHAEDRIEIARGGLVEGDLFAPKIVISDGARFKGRIDMISGTSEATKEAFEESVEDSAFDEAPDDFADEIIDDLVDESPARQESETKQKGKKSEKKGSKQQSGDDPKLSKIFEEFDPTNP